MARLTADDPIADLFDRRQVESDRVGVVAPEAWDAWLHALFPHYVSVGFAPHHEEYWRHVWAIQPGDTPVPFVGIWARGGGKSTGIELGTVALGLRNRRRYAVYVRETQDQADNSVSNIGALLESDSVERYYPEHAERRVGKYGDSKGWRRNRLRTAGGFTVDALGLDVASRGIKVEEQRPDLIILDDIDGKLDSASTTAKKIATITHSILPAGSLNAAVLAVQNLIVPDGVFTRMVDGRADYLATRIVSGPHPALRDMEYEWEEDRESHARRAVITGGVPTWQGQGLVECQALVDRVGLAAFEKECQHKVQNRGQGLALRVTMEDIEDLSDDEARRIVGLGSAFGGMDFGDWRFGFTLRAADEHGVVHQVGEYFSQREQAGLEYRARVVHAICDHYRCPDHFRIWGDAANPQDIREINIALGRLGSPYRVTSVAGENKQRAVAVERMNDLLARKALKFRRGVSEVMHRVVGEQWETLGYTGLAPDLRRWLLGYNVSSGGTEMIGSRLLWEVEHWAYPAPKEGEAQRQDPDDNSADGADLIAADRYGIMSWWRPPKVEEKPEPVDHNFDRGLEKVLETYQRNRLRAKRGGY